MKFYNKIKGEKMTDKCKFKSENLKDKFFWDRLNYSRCKQSDHLNAMIGVGIGFIFGIFSIPENRWLVIIPFLITIMVIFLHFYGRYFYWHLEECSIEAILNIEDTANFKSSIKDFKAVETFQELRKKPEFDNWLKSNYNKGLRKYYFFFYNCGLKIELAVTLIFGSITLFLLFINI